MKNFLIYFLLVSVPNFVFAKSQTEFKCMNGYTKTSFTDYNECYKNLPNPGIGDIYTLFYNMKKEFYYVKLISHNGLDTERFCGTECDIDGRNCKYGFCNPKDCAPGYTQIISKGYCYNPKTKIAYDIDKFFYRYNDGLIGYNCNFDGKECILEFQSIKDCQEGFTELIDGKCYNPVSLLSYDAQKNFYYNERQCGKVCNCKGEYCGFDVYGSPEGVSNNDHSCSISYLGGCAKDYENLPNGKCYNKDTDISYDLFENFYLGNEKCGEHCDEKAENCTDGVCSKKSCLNGEVRKKSYGENEQYYEYVCYNPKTKVYCSNSNRNYECIYSNQQYYCGKKCDSNGLNCKEGSCSGKFVSKYIMPIGEKIKYFIESIGILFSGNW